LKKNIQKYDGKKYNIEEYLPVIFQFGFLIGFIFLIGLAIYTIRKKGNYEDVYLSTVFNETVVDVFEEKGDTYLLLTNRKNRYRLENSNNYDYKPAFLYDFLKENDRVIKNKCSDTIFIERDSKKYHYLIGSTSYNSKGRSKEFIQKYLNERVIMNDRNDCD